MNAATRIVIYAIAALGLDLILGYGGMVSFGHAAYFALGGYTVAILAANGVDAALISWPAAILVAAAFAAAVGALSLRTSGIFFIMITLAFAQMIYYATIAVKAFGGADGMSLAARSVVPGIDLRDPRVLYAVTLVMLFGALALAGVLIDSRFGVALRACRGNERRVRALGFSVFRTKLAAFAIAGAIAGLAGALWAEYARFVSPDMGSWTRSGEFLIVAILGGTGTLAGAIFGSTVLLELESLLAGVTEHWMIALGAILLVVVLFAKRGLYGWLAGSSDG
ncbi:branched-chain amino acid ABC transporter permease [Vulcanimicrobium alpinum]|uniref:Branched-chain amino acid ABC transporter permease n=1 Tax=Vulcanimicrobium alpinum TaxID=3016050 RepID=A0AAN1Y009_UNVUL|nr:branched-chain amino acid ABC transporter permease [Vulcanimicrobium alpinum]BDE08110.1 branched-chain amino acid ABC transporter permease [Vulcanimicrobium alpinum]